MIEFLKFHWKKYLFILVANIMTLLMFLRFYTIPIYIFFSAIVLSSLYIILRDWDRFHIQQTPVKGLREKSHREALQPDVKSGKIDERVETKPSIGDTANAEVNSQTELVEQSDKSASNGVQSESVDEETK